MYLENVQSKSTYYWVSSWQVQALNVWVTFLKNAVKQFHELIFTNWYEMRSKWLYLVHRKLCTFFYSRHSYVKFHPVKHFKRHIYLKLARTLCLRLHTRQFFHSYSSRLHFSLPERAVISVDAIAELAWRRTEQRSAWHFAAQIALDEASVGEVIGRSHFFLMLVASVSPERMSKAGQKDDLWFLFSASQSAPFLIRI